MPLNRLQIKPQTPNMALLTPDLGFIFWHTIIFLTSHLVLKRYAWKPILQAIKAREQAYEKSINTIKKAQKEITELQQEKSKIIKSAHTQSNVILEQAMTNREKLLKKAQQEALEEKQKIINHALTTIELEKQAAQSAIKKQTVTLILQTTKKLITQKLTTDPAQHQLIQHMIEEVENTHNTHQMPTTSPQTHVT